MRTLIVLLLSAAYNTFVNARFPPLEVYQIKESKKNHQLFIENESQQYSDSYESQLAALFNQYMRKKALDEQVEEVTRDLVKKLKFLRKDRKKDDRYRAKANFYVVDDGVVLPDYYSDEDEEFYDETRNGKHRDAKYESDRNYVTLKERINSDMKRRPSNPLRTQEGTSAPRHHYRYGRRN